MEIHEQHVKIVLSRLQQHKLYAKLEKCQFEVDTIDFVGYTISPKGVSMDKSKIKTILDWKPPQNIHDIQVFLGFCNFYRRFINNFAKISAPLTRLLRKNQKFQWDSMAQQSFETLKTMFTSAPILAHPDPKLPFIVETNASSFAIGCILSQVNPVTNKLHLCLLFKIYVRVGKK